jgi:hypothetical protein
MPLNNNVHVKISLVYFCYKTIVTFSCYTYSCISVLFKDIHAAANAIMQLHNLSIERIRIKLVESWLLADSVSSGSLDESFVDASQMWQQFDDDVNKANQESDDNLLK